jgi:Kef-type K+ transport system membrane component KefB
MRRRWPRPAVSLPIPWLRGLGDADPIVVIALLMVVAVLAADLVERRLRLPRAVGPLLVGALAGHASLGWIGSADLLPWKPLIDLGVGLMLFELGARIRPRWLLDNPGLAAQGLAEALLSGAAVTAALALLGAPLPSALLAGAVAMASSPVLTLAGVHALQARGQVAERVLLLAALNSILAVLALKAWSVLALLDAPAGSPWPAVLVSALHALLGSCLIGAIAGLLLKALSERVAIGRSRGVLQLALVILASVLSAHWALSPLLTLLVAGMVARERMGHALRVEPQFGVAGAALQLLLFLSLGLMSSLALRADLLLWAGAIVVARLAGKAVGVFLFARPSGLGWRQSLALTLALQPAAGLVVLSAGSGTLGAGFDWPLAWPAPDARVFQALALALGWLQLIGAVAADIGLRRIAGEGAEPGRQP